MADREKVVKDLEECLSASCRGYRPRLSCPYNDEEWDIMRDALALVKEDCHNCKIECLLQRYDELKAKYDALLKEQEAVEPINSYGTFRCGNCRNIVGYNDGHGRWYQNNFCSNCGQAVKWR